MFETLDRIMNLDIGQRGVDKLYAPARARSDEPLCAAAARHLSRTKAGDCVVLITGSLTRPWVSLNIGEIGARVPGTTIGLDAVPGIWLYGGGGLVAMTLGALLIVAPRRMCVTTV